MLGWNPGGADPVHPRWRGEHGTALADWIRDRGSSPLARGTHAGNGAARAGYRFIPAGAGNTRADSMTEPNSSVHPRWRGEHVAEPVAELHVVRFIPAGAGNTLHLSI